MVTLRPYRPDDLEGLYDICLKTGDASRDATPLHNDPHLVGHIYSAPYGVLEPQNVFVAEDDAGIAGYIVGTMNTERFARRLDADWWPPLRERYRDAKGLTEADHKRIAAIMTPDAAPADLVRDYPAHIHMNLLSRLRGQRIGSKLLEMWVDQARRAGSPGIHLGASASNAGGIAFWTKSGFTPLRENSDAVWFGMKL